MTNHHDNKMQWFWLGVRRLFSAKMSSTLSRLRSLMMTALCRRGPLYYCTCSDSGPVRKSATFRGCCRSAVHPRTHAI